MISPVDGAVDFEDGLHLNAFGPVPVGNMGPVRVFALPGWHCYEMGERLSEHGRFRVEVVCDPEHRIALVWLCHCHAFYDVSAVEPPAKKPRHARDHGRYGNDENGDPERRAFHEGVISRDLAGQRDFSWGAVYLRYDPAERRDALIVAYSRNAAVPYVPTPAPGELIEYALEPKAPPLYTDIPPTLP